MGNVPTPENPFSVADHTLTPALKTDLKKQKQKQNVGCRVGRSHASVGAVCASTCGTTTGPASPRWWAIVHAWPPQAGHRCRLLVRRVCTPRRRTPNLRAPALRTSHPRWRRPATEPHPTTAGVARTNPAAAIPGPVTALELAELAWLPRPQPCGPWKKYDVSTNHFFIVKVLYVCIRQIDRN